MVVRLLVSSLASVVVESLQNNFTIKISKMHTSELSFHFFTPVINVYQNCRLPHSYSQVVIH